MGVITTPPVLAQHAPAYSVEMLSDDELESVLVITAHPDDVDFGASGTIARWTDLGVRVTYCICTNGDAGGFDPAVPRHEIPHIRQAEQRAAAHAVGVTDVRFLGYPDGKLEVTQDLRRDISRVIRQVRPQRVLCQSPEFNYERIYASHPDHRVAGEAALVAVYPDARNPFAHPELDAEGLQAWTVPEIWIMGAPHNNHAVDITDHLPKKLHALLSHVSQTEHIAKELEGQLREWNGGVAKQFGLGEHRLAEGFLTVNTK